ncbi:MAG: TIGR03960 family B12-binding radical SAM protein [Clostridiales bacterium]|nr:TIGR03960 family B12-binding radical SAM protein [Clostridiales bacterium]
MTELENARLEALLETVQKPARYIGGEMNAVVKDWEKVKARFAFCFPDTYEIAMSHLGMKILYHLINEREDALCERVCMPGADMADGMRKENVPLFGLESRHSLLEFDIVGFTLQYEMSFTNILEMLDLGRIPVYGKDRSEEMPIIVAGGPCAFNPEPLAPFIDAFMIGDGEEVMHELIDVIRDGRAAKKSRLDILRALAGVEGVYVPCLYEATYNEDGTLASFGPIDPAAPAVVKKRVVKDLTAASYPDNIPVPYTEIVHDRMVLEIMRGCTRGCRFCQAGMLYRPVRERSMDRLLELADALQKSTGYEEMSLSSLSSGDFTCLPQLIASLMERYKEKRVSVSLPSMRIDNIVKQSLEETQQVKKSGLTLAPEAGTQRLRDVINKGVTEEDLIRAVSDAFECGWSSVKLYFMMGLPTETDEDLQGIGMLAKKVVWAYYRLPKEQRSKNGLKVTCSASVFVPKPFTPFQWAGQDTIEMVHEKQAALRQYLKTKCVNFNWHESYLSQLEAAVTRGDRRIGEVIYHAWKRGCRLDGWNEHFKYDEWMNAFQDCGLDIAFYAHREKPYDELLPWQFIDAGVSQEYLKRECEKAKRGEITRDCRKGCNGCGLHKWDVCDWVKNPPLKDTDETQAPLFD